MAKLTSKFEGLKLCLSEVHDVIVPMPTFIIVSDHKVPENIPPGTLVPKADFTETTQALQNMSDKLKTVSQAFKDLTR